MIRNELSMNAAATVNNTDQTHEIKIGKTTYIVVSHFNDEAKENATSKIERLILRDLKLSS